MSTDRRELLDLQAQARLDGRTVEFQLDREGWIDKVYYLDPKGQGHLRKGMTLGPISFAELERAKAPQYDL